MPNKTITAPGDTKAENIGNAGGTGASYASVRNATTPSASLIGNFRQSQVRHVSSSNKYFITRGLVLYDFTGSPIEQGIRVQRAELILNDVTVQVETTNGDKITVGHVFNPNTFGSLHANDYSRARYSTGATTQDTRTSAQQMTNGADGAIVTLDNRNLLKQIEKAINGKTYLHLVIRNALDSGNATPGSNETNRVWFDRPNADDNPMQLRVYYRIINNQRNIGGGGIGRASTSGFGGTNLFCGTSSGFGNQ